jgi:hypothetical protein
MWFVTGEVAKGTVSKWNWQIMPPRRKEVAEERLVWWGRYCNATLLVMNHRQAM